MDHQALDVRHIGQEGENLQMIDEGPGFLLAALDLKGEDGSAALREETFVDFVIRMIREGRMIDFLHQRMILQVFHYLQGVFHMTLQPQAEGFHTLQEQERVEGGDGRTGIAQEDRTDIGDKSGRADGIVEGNAMVARIRRSDIRVLSGSLPVELSAFNDYAAQGGSVSADEFGRGMNNDVRITRGSPWLWAIFATASISGISLLGLPRVSR